MWRPSKVLSVACLLIISPAHCSSWAANPIPPYMVGQKETSPAELSQRLNELKSKVATNPNNSESLLELSEVECQLGDLDQAIKHARTAALSTPKDWRIHAALSRFYLLDRNSLAAQLQAERALELTTDAGNRRMVLRFLLPALIEQKNFAKADKISKGELKKTPRDAFLSFCRAWVLAFREPAEAIAAYRRSLLLVPKLAESHYNLALLLAQSNQEEALAELKSFINDSTDPAQAQLGEDLMSRLTHQD